MSRNIVSDDTWPCVAWQSGKGGKEIGVKNMVRWTKVRDVVSGFMLGDMRWRGMQIDVPGAELQCSCGSACACHSVRERAVRLLGTKKRLQAMHAGVVGIVLMLVLLALADCCEHAAPSSDRECWSIRGNE